MVVRGYPLGTIQDRCEWHTSGTAGEEDVACAWRRRRPGRRELTRVLGDGLIRGWSTEAGHPARDGYSVDASARWS